MNTEFAADAAFRIGKTHRVCQDYAIAGGADAPRHGVWLSDGCSSSPHTDIGARLLAHGLQLSSGTPRCPQESLSDAYAEAARCADALSLPLTCLDATVLGLFVADQTLHALLCGDGALVYGHRDGTRTVFRLQYPAGYPFYPAYLVAADRRANWQTVPGNNWTITRTILEADGMVRESVPHPCGDAPALWREPLTNLRFAAVLSDGVESFQAQTEGHFASVDYLAVAWELTAFKGFKGEFVQRRLQAFEKECVKRGWHHNDDVSVAAIAFGEE